MSEEPRALRRALRQQVDSLTGFGVSGVPLSRRPAVEAPRRAAREAGASDGASAEQRLARLAADVAKCRRCPLYKTRTHPVVSDGSPGAKLMFIGEAPGRDEDLQGKPFVGAAGQLLTKMIVAMGFRREDVYICNVLKDRPPGNRVPLPEEIEACFPFLQEQIAVIKPRVICTLGAVATRAMLGPDVSITKIRGSIYDYEGIRLVPTFHPAYLLRNPPAKKYSWIDLKLVKKLLDKPA